MSGPSSSALEDHLQRFGSRSNAGDDDDEDCSDAYETGGRGSVEHPIGRVKASEEEPSFLSMVFADSAPNRGTITDNVSVTVKGALLLYMTVLSRVSARFPLSIPNHISRSRLTSQGQERK